MHESISPVLTACKGCVLALFVALFSLSPARAASEQPATYAVESSRASQSLLLGIASAGARRVTVGDRGHILYSDDQVISWQQGRVPSRQLLTSVFFVDDQRGWAVGHDAQILHSVDGGENWSLQYSDPELEAPLLDILFVDARRGFAVGAYGSLLRTRDGGAHWDSISDALDNEDGFHLNAITRLTDGTLVIVGEMGVLFRSTDAGDSWEALDSPYEGSLFGVLPTRETQGLVMYGLRGHVFRSDDAGDSWQEIALQRAEGGRFEFGLAGGALLYDGSLVIVGHGGALLRSQDNGQSFQVTLREDRQSYAGVAAGDDGRLLLVGQSGVQVAPAASPSRQ